MSRELICLFPGCVMHRDHVGKCITQEMLDSSSHRTPADRGNSASDMHERTTRHDDRGKIQGVDR